MSCRIQQFYSRKFTTIVASPKIFGAMILQRDPITLQPLTPFEQEYFQYKEALNQQISKGPMDFSAFIADDLHAAAAATNSNNNPDKGRAAESSTAYVDDEMKQLMQASERIYAAFSHNRQSLKRELHRKLYLMVRLAADRRWMFPCAAFDGTRDAGKSLDQVAVRSIAAFSGAMQTYFVGCAPVAVFGAARRVIDAAAAAMQSQTTADQEEDSGVRHFFFRGHVLSGGIQADAFEAAAVAKQHPYCEFAWLTKQEIQEAVDKAYFDSVHDVLSN